MSSNKNYQKQDATVNYSETLLNKHYPIMSSNKVYQKQDATVNSSDTFLNKRQPTMSSNNVHRNSKAIVNFSEIKYTHQLSNEQIYLKVQRLQADATLSEAKLSEAHAEIENLKTQLKETEEHLIKAQVNQKVSEALNFLYDAKFKNMQAQIDEFDNLTTQAQEFFGKIWKEYETQSKNKLNESEALRIQGLEDLKACRSEFQCYKAQTEKRIEELENTRVKAHQVLIAQKTRCSELESQMICLTAQAQRAHAASQAIQQSVDREKAAFKDRLKKQLAFFKSQHDEFLAEWEGTDKRVKQALLDELVKAVADLPIEPEVPKTLHFQAQAQPAETGFPKKRGQAPKMETQTAKKRRIE